MSATALHESVDSRPTAQPGHRVPEPFALRIFEWVTVFVALAALIAGIGAWHDRGSREVVDVLVWLPVVVVADLMPVTLWNPIELTMSLPVLLAASMVFPPVVAFGLGFVGNTDMREFRRDISFSRGLFNRSNVAVSVFAASWLFHETGGTLTAWPSAVGYAFLALAADMLMNNTITLAGAHLLFQRPIRELLDEVYGRGRPIQFLLRYISFGSMAILLSSVYLFAGNWGLIVFVIPVLLAHEMFSNGAALGVAAVRVRHQQRAIGTLSERVAAERRDERLSVAADLHDEVLPPLFKVHLMGQVIRQDIASGRLLDLDDDVPGLLDAANAANDAIRFLIGDLRRSSLGPHGLKHTLHMLTRQVEAEFGATIHTELDEVAGNPVAHLLAFQVAREAINNCLKHAPGSSIRVALVRGDQDFRVVVEDAGPGFVVDHVDSEKHFGLQLMRERVELCGGTIVIDSRPGAGTRVVARFPVPSSYGS